MDMPEAIDPIWEDLVTGRRACRLRFLAAKILLTRLTRSVAADRSPETIQTGAAQLHALFANNRNMPSVQEDLRALLSCLDAPTTSPHAS